MLVPGPSADHRRTESSTSPLFGLLHLWEDYLRCGRRQLLELGDRVILQPLLAPGFAEADLVVGRTIVDVKTNLDPRPYLDAWLDQLLAYVLLDRWNVFYLTDIAVFAGWHATLCRSSIDSVLLAGSRGETPTLDDLREQFHETMQFDLGRALRSYMHRRYPPPDDVWVTLEEPAEQPDL